MRFLLLPCIFCIFQIDIGIYCVFCAYGERCVVYFTGSRFLLLTLDSEMAYFSFFVRLLTICLFSFKTHAIQEKFIA